MLVYLLVGLYRDGGINFCEIYATKALAEEAREKEINLLIESTDYSIREQNTVTYYRNYEDSDGFHEEKVAVTFKIVEKQVIE